MKPPNVNFLKSTLKKSEFVNRKNPHFVFGTMFLLLLGCQTKNAIPELIDARKRLERHPSDEYYFKKAWSLVDKLGEKNWDAVANYEAAIKINSTIPGYKNDLGNCYRSLQLYDSALHYYTIAINQGFGLSAIWYNRAICKYELGDQSGAKEDYELANEKGWSDDYYSLYKKLKLRTKIEVRNETDYLNFSGVINEYDYNSRLGDLIFFEDIDGDNVKDLIVILVKKQKSNSANEELTEMEIFLFSSICFFEDRTFQKYKWSPYMFNRIEKRLSTIAISGDSLALGVFENLTIEFDHVAKRFKILKHEQFPQNNGVAQKKLVNIIIE